MGVLQFHQLYAVFPPELALTDSLKTNFLHFINLPEGGGSFLVTPTYLETPSDALKRSFIGETFRKHGKQIKHFAARSSRPERLAFSLPEVIDHLSFHSGRVNGEALETSDAHLTEGCSLGPAEVEGDVLEREKKMGGVSAHSCRWSCPV